MIMILCIVCLYVHGMLLTRLYFRHSVLSIRGWGRRCSFASVKTSRSFYFLLWTLLEDFVSGLYAPSILFKSWSVDQNTHNTITSPNSANNELYNQQLWTALALTDWNNLKIISFFTICYWWLYIYDYNPTNNSSRFSLTPFPRWFDHFIISVILINCVLLATETEKDWIE